MGEPGPVERRPNRRRIRKPEQLAVRRSLLRDAVFAILLENILLGAYRRGERLRLEDIADDLQVSRTPVREALVPLEALRLVVVQRYVGVVIAHWSVDHMVERLRIARSMLDEPPACAGAALTELRQGLVGGGVADDIVDDDVIAGFGEGIGDAAANAAPAAGDKDARPLAHASNCRAISMRWIWLVPS